MASRSKAWVCGRWIAEIVSSNPAWLCVVCCQVEVSVSGRSLVQRSPTERGVSECDHESSIKRRPWPTGAVEPW